MSLIDVMAAEFLAQERIAVAGVSRHDANAPANLIYRKLRSAGRRVFALNPQASSVEGETCYATLHAIPGGVDLVVVATPPQAAEMVVRECAELGIPRVWLHRSIGQGSVTPEAVALCQERGIRVIPGACQMMFCQPVDFPHKCMRWVLRVTGNLPKCVE